MADQPTRTTHLILDEPAPTARQVWFALVAFILLCAPALYVSLGVRDTIHTMENISLMSSQETWLRQHGWHDIERDPRAWLVPSHNGRPRINKPPLLVWFNLMAWSDLTPGTSTVEQLTWRSRVVSSTLGLLMLLGVFSIGRNLGDFRTGLLAALAAGTMWFFQRQARNASYDIYMAAWITLSIAAALWATRPWRTAPPWWRWGLGWSLAGVFLGLGVLSKGALALPLTLAPLVVMLVLCRDRWNRWVPGLLLAVLVGLAVSLPWYVYIWQHFPDAGVYLSTEYRARRAEFQTPFYYLALVALVWPWSFYLLGALFQPFKLAQPPRRGQLWPAWAWFVLVFVLFSIPGAKEQRYILPIIPAAALLIAQLWRDHEKLFEEQGGADPGMPLLMWPHWIGMMAASVAIGPFLAMQTWLVNHGYSDQQPIGQVTPWLAIPLGAVMTGITVAGLRHHLRRRIHAAANLSAVWAAVFSTSLLVAYCHAPHGHHWLKPDAQAVAQFVGDAPLRYLKLGNDDLWPNEEFAFFSRRLVLAVTPKTLEAYRAGGCDDRPAYVMSDADDTHDQIMRDAGFRLVYLFVQDKDRGQRLWRYPAPAGPPTPPALSPLMAAASAQR